MSRTRSRLGKVVSGLVILLAIPQVSHAHTPIAGVDGFFGGVIHPITTPTHLLILLGLGLLAGQRSSLGLKVSLLAFVPISGLALLVAGTGLCQSLYPPLLISLAIISGILVALNQPLPTWSYAVIFAFAALAIGLDSSVDTANRAELTKGLLGTWVGLILIICDLAFYISISTKQKWQKIGVRVAGSWLTAASLMILAFALRR